HHSRRPPSKRQGEPRRNRDPPSKRLLCRRSSVLPTHSLHHPKTQRPAPSPILQAGRAQIEKDELYAAPAVEGIDLRPVADVDVVAYVQMLGHIAAAPHHPADWRGKIGIE